MQLGLSEYAFSVCSVQDETCPTIDQVCISVVFSPWWIPVLYYQGTRTMINTLVPLNCFSVILLANAEPVYSHMLQYAESVR